MSQAAWIGCSPSAQIGLIFSAVLALSQHFYYWANIQGETKPWLWVFPKLHPTIGSVVTVYSQRRVPALPRQYEQANFLERGQPASELGGGQGRKTRLSSAHSRRGHLEGKREKKVPGSKNRDG